MLLSLNPALWLDNFGVKECTENFMGKNYSHFIWEYVLSSNTSDMKELMCLYYTFSVA
jgi:hypothetical protein